MTWCGKPHLHTISSPQSLQGISPFFLMFRREAAAKHMLLAEESTKYVGDNEGILNLKLMQQLYHVIAYNLAKSRTARDGNRILKRKNFKPKHLKTKWSRTGKGSYIKGI